MMEAARLTRGARGLARALGLAAGLALVGCQSGETGCRESSECDGGVCVAGQCRPIVDSDLAAADALGPVTDGAPAPNDGGLGDAIAPLCSGNGDGVIARGEEPFLVGLGTLFAVNPSGQTVSVSLAESAGGWDYSTPVSGEQKDFDQLLAPAGRWWATDFSSATYAEILEDGQSLYGVYQVTDSALKLQGIVSANSGVGQTELTYATAIDTLRFPLKLGDTWTQTAAVSGWAEGVFVPAASDTYTFTVDARGTVKVPAGSFDTLRVRVDYSETVGLVTTTRITYLYIAECFGTVARIRSRDDEPSANFTTAAEYRRLATQ
jgi:hypothetical protein